MFSATRVQLLTSNTTLSRSSNRCLRSLVTGVCAFTNESNRLHKLGRLTAPGGCGARFLGGVRLLGSTVRRRHTVQFRCYACSVGNGLIPHLSDSDSPGRCQISPCRLVCGGDGCCLVYRVRRRSDLSCLRIRQFHNLAVDDASRSLGHALSDFDPIPKAPFGIARRVGRHPCPVGKGTMPVRVHVGNALRPLCS